MPTAKPAELPPTPTSVRLPPELRAALERSAVQSTRSLSSEIIKRLFDSVALEQGRGRDGRPDFAVMEGDQPAYFVQTKNTTPTLAEDRLLLLYRELSPERQLALLTLLKA